MLQRFTDNTAGTRVPEARGAVYRASHDKLAVGAESRGTNDITMPEFADHPATLYIPHASRLVVRGGDDAGTVRAKGGGPDRNVMLQRLTGDFLIGPRIPQVRTVPPRR